LNLVKEKISNDNRQWLIVLDNVDNRQTLFGDSRDDSTCRKFSQLLSYIPQSERVKIMVTTRDQRIGTDLTNIAATIEIPSLTEPEAKNLFASKLPRMDHDDTMLTSLVKEMEFLPLAITQAAGFITSRKISLEKYLQIYHKDYAEAKLLLEHSNHDTRRDNEASNSIIRTWKISFDQIAKDDPRTARMLSLMAMLDRQGIPASLLRNKGEYETMFVSAVATLLAFSLITEEKGGDSYSIHRLVQLSIRWWLELQGSMSEWELTALELLKEAFPYGKYENWSSCEILLPHAEAVLQYESENVTHSVSFALLLHNIAAFDQSHGQYQEAREKLSRALSIRESVLGTDESDTLNSVSNLALVLGRQGKYEEAERLNRRALEARESTLGMDHPDTLTSLNNLASVLDSQGKYKEAERLNRRALEARESTLGMNHPDTLSSVSNLASVLDSQGKYEEAERLNRRALEARESTLGMDHPSTLTSVNNLALVLNRQGKYEEAERLNRRALEAKERTLGVDHPDTLVTVNNLASLLEENKRYTESMELYERAYKGFADKLGPDHHYTNECMSDIADLQRKIDSLSLVQ
jgi:tetratricopeptide (TPR) repeat protein